MPSDARVPSSLRSRDVFDNADSSRHNANLSWPAMENYLGRCNSWNSDHHHLRHLGGGLPSL
ncbi:hypothetical protein M408DRAFT_331633 [Serendipita vermifera MAFF 305830]|uniref:Uncharacterized protein n=1 Tax=Serendipita vermifera MAFF 305830 TaxID=933852 RepID=A0A0C3AJ72_SERVB|nr:hypothetical protein M408DRAFT_331633 [Serendipita vermifera MAFF 305830]